MSLTLGACARDTIIVLCLSVSVIKLAATYLICKSKTQYHTVLYGVPNACIVWISPTLLSGGSRIS